MSDQKDRLLPLVECLEAQVEKPLIYVAGPYTHPDPVLNVRAACLAADELVEAGAAVIVPHLSMLWHTISPKPIDDWYAIDLDLLAHCNALVRLPGASTGADAEVAEADRIGMPVLTLAGAVQMLAMVSG